jgi:phage terminase small subunit
VVVRAKREIIQAVGKSSLTLKEQLFVAAYTGVAFGNASKAYAIAGYSTRGKPNHVTAMACQLRWKPSIARAIATKLRGKLLRLEKMSGDRILKLLANQAEADVTDYLPQDHPLRLLPEHLRRRVKKVKFHEDGSLQEVEVHDVQRALELLAKNAGLLSQDEGDRVTLADILETINGPVFGPLIARRALPPPRVETPATTVEVDVDPFGPDPEY